MRSYLLATSALALFTLAPAGHAQDTSAQAPQQEGLGEIIVTAQRRAESLQKAAVAVTAVTGDALITQGVTDATRLNQVAPALFVTNGGGSNTGFFVRGVGNFTNNGYTAPAVAFNIDDVYVGRPSSTIASFLDLNRVEVLKGPQGTLYGRNATGGAVNVIPNKPKLGVFEGNVAGQYGNYDAYELTGVINAPLGDRVALRLAAVKSARDGYF
ncbi:MAG: TonB-dependent receptor plug domain-containing protein, partial [Novosphingobium sp.]|uniref:TonB-dependent receptor plug domain-containing protein n=1 Tax=Novosphingobium sp. TaxID=1874826 RepID=UPI003B9CA59C